MLGGGVAPFNSGLVLRAMSANRGACDDVPHQQFPHLHFRQNTLMLAHSRHKQLLTTGYLKIQEINSC